MYVATTRFNNETYIENCIWRKKHKYKGCIYGLPHRITNKFLPYKNVLIIEMNNELDLIMGVGCIVNYLKLDKKYNIHKDPKFNRYIYKGKKRVDRKDIDPYILGQLEYVMFKTSKHQKRLRGITYVETKNFGEIIDDDFYIGDKVKMIKGKDKGKTGTIVDKKGSKIVVQYVDEENKIKLWSLRYALKNYIKVDKIEKKEKNTNKIKKKGFYKCSLCGQIKKNHNCPMITQSKKIEKYIYEYLNNLFN